MANQTPAGTERQELVIRRIRVNGRADYLSARSGWTSNLELAQVFLSDGAARKTLRKRAAEIITKPQF